MPNFITNTAIVNESWNPRGLVTHNAVTKALVRADNGTLWAAVRENHVKEYINIYRSTDGGFSWENMYAGDFATVNRFTGLSGLNQNGPFMHLTLNEERDRLILWHSYYDTGTSKYNVEPFIFEITDSGLERKTEAADSAVTSIVTDMDQLAFDVSYNSNYIFLTYVSFSALTVKVYHWNYQLAAEQTQSTGNTYYNIFSSHANDNSSVDIAVVKEDGANYTVQYIIFDKFTNTFLTPVTVSSFAAADVADVNIERDGQNNILIYWSQQNTAGTTIVEKYATSTNGTSWTVNDIPDTAGQSDFTDYATGRLAGRTVALAGLQGFLLGYVRTVNTSPQAYIRTLLWNADTSSYDLGDEKVAVDNECVGFRFFRPTGTQLMDLDQLGQIRIGYTIGRATSTTQKNASPVYLGQQLLRQSSAFAEEVTVYEADQPDEGQLLVQFNLLGAIDENIDYYAVGLTGGVTNKYLAAFNKVGTVLSFYRYEPNLYAETSDRSAYAGPTITVAKAVLEPVNYDFPNPTGNESFTSYIERDTRKIHLPPNFHLARTFLVNAGNHLKRTVWLVRFDGNEYEISQVVPRFLHDQIAYYEANAYVVGPSNDPFSRVILPSET